MSGMPSDHPDAIERMNRFVQRMNEVDRKLTAAYVAPKDAATLILVDRSGTTPKVLLGKRHARHKFMPGKFVFPGGRVDRSDTRMPVAKALNPAAQANLLKRIVRPSPAKAQASLPSAKPSRRRVCCSASRLAMCRAYRGGRGRRSRKRRSCLILPISISSDARSRHPAGRAASTRVSSRSMQAQSHTVSWG